MYSKVANTGAGKTEMMYPLVAAEEFIQYDGLTAKVLRMPEAQVKREIRYWEYD